MVRNQLIDLASVTVSNHIQLISVNKISVPLVYLPSGRAHFSCSTILFPLLIANIYRGSECQVSEHNVPLLGIRLLGLRASFDNVRVLGLEESFWQNLC